MNGLQSNELVGLPCTKTIGVPSPIAAPDAAAKTAERLDHRDVGEGAHGARPYRLRAAPATTLGKSLKGWPGRADRGIA